jgi:NAD(P)-dependent dehydrogenase (short-subunit alcohol dehydrogenase family)
MTIVVITGGSRGLGAATARACAQRGMGVILTLTPTRSRRVDTITEDGGTAVALPLNVVDTSTFGEFRDTVQAASKQYGAVRISTLWSTTPDTACTTRSLR